MLDLKCKRSTEPYTFKPVEFKHTTFQHFEIGDLNRFTEYSIVVQAYNSRGAGPPSEEALVRTLEFVLELQIGYHTGFQN
ncbi:uncharacterized protein CEXT_155561 [Caerostris extrusa]|uniref:Fibronectin type-III domain-containing protein n=1 Tax=Caerostris extrusa TaxID=172846 RepID=A0AAV4XA91_CAEEX|nr:uncharacterized protein CEXT_155561 [Caerostris extrusa]